ncbi:acyl-CoA carboxylase subunit epsilon [Microbacterium sp. QXD-8]|uniref:Acyl-CoA carboxylase subunit epsilon n=1 Tax=Microbacterium psychrotolerans TaxID=3068321 RepID=A0ABU0Z2B7_9MICO|nr:acyl-CoA carboxylase subunit epsilon [Microbacterium sp. QXD-8]MDQ7878734.1 acyl-CoA carboxylase subunit epsilon [Microbacterium sp. QXD-8]
MSRADDQTVPAEAGGESAARESVTIDVRRGTPTEEELAALIAVVSEAYTGEAAEAVAEERVRRTGWELSQRALRQPLDRDLGWGRFG